MGLIKKIKNLFWEKDYLLVIGVLTVIYALFLPTQRNIFLDYLRLLSHQTYLLHDFFAVAGQGATFLNVGFHFLIAYYLNVRNNLTKLTGLQLAATGMFVGHAFFGTHLLNISPIFIGVILYAKFSDRSFKFYTSLSLFATSTGPVVSFLLFNWGLSIGTILLAMAVGVIIGFISPPLAEEFLKFHKGYTLYNFGFTGGIIMMFVYACLRYLEIDIPKVMLVSEEAHMALLIYLLALCLSLLIASYYNYHDAGMMTKFVKLNRRIGRLPDDFILKYGKGTTFFNMGIMGLVYLSLCLSLGIRLNGPTAGGFLAVIGFSAFGKHLRNTLPLATGVVLATYLRGQDFNHVSFTLPLLFGTSLAPIAGYYGIIAGMIAGFFQYNMTQSVIGLHVGLSLYNNGFSSGFVAGFLVPVFDTIRDFWHKDVEEGA